MNQNSERPDLVVPEDSVLGGSAGQIDMVPQLIAVLEVQPRIAIHVGRLDLDIDPFFEQPVEDPEHDAFGGQLEAYGERVGIKEDVDLVRGAFQSAKAEPGLVGGSGSSSWSIRYLFESESLRVSHERGTCVVDVGLCTVLHQAGFGGSRRPFGFLLDDVGRVAVLGRGEGLAWCFIEVSD